MATVLVGGASGFIGSRMTGALAREGHRIVPLTRRNDQDAVRWDAESGTIDTIALARVTPDIVINLAGEPIAQRWSSERKRRIRDSRVVGTGALAQALTRLSPRPRLFISGSAIGYYGAHRGNSILDEASAAGDDWLGRVALEWEGATAPAADAGIRVVISRTGVVLGEDGGMLERLLLPFRLGVGGNIGDGSRWLSWISMEDYVRAIQFAIASHTLAGPVNVVAPDPVQNRQFTQALGAVLGRPTLIPVPAFGLRLVFGEMAEDTILASQRVIPKKLAGAGFEFRHPHIQQALRAELTRSGDRAGH
jgi:uncharacterized protein